MPQIFYVMQHQRTKRVVWAANVYEANYWADAGYLVVAETPREPEACANRLPEP